jgi:hypothetical protein
MLHEGKMTRAEELPELDEMPIELYRMVDGREIMRHINLSDKSCNITQLKRYVVYLLTQAINEERERAGDIAKEFMNTCVYPYKTKADQNEEQAVLRHWGELIATAIRGKDEAK